jgi:hypothetical protein
MTDETLKRRYLKLLTYTGLCVVNISKVYYELIKREIKRRPIYE